MHRKIIFSVFSLLILGFAAEAQITPPLKTYRIAIFSPIYLDSVFADGNYKYGKGFPKFAQQGLNFVQGAQIALDSLVINNTNVEVNIYDSKSETENITSLINMHKLDSTDLIIGAVKDAEFLQLAGFAKQKNVPFISSVYPNDGGMTANPFVVILNSTLKAHCEAIHSYLLQNHAADKIILCTAKGTQEDKIAGYFKTINQAEGKPLLNIKTYSSEQNFALLKNVLDSTRKNIIIGGSLSEGFAAELIKTLSDVKNKYRIEIIGMPNWDGFTEIKKPAYKDFPVLYTTPYTFSRNDFYFKKLQDAYSKKYKSSPSEMSIKGFETVFMFTYLLNSNPFDFMSHLNDAPKVFNDYNFKPVYLNKKSVAPDYFENKHLYFMKIVNGKLSKAW